MPQDALGFACWPTSRRPHCRTCQLPLYHAAGHNTTSPMTSYHFQNIALLPARFFVMPLFSRHATGRKMISPMTISGHGSFRAHAERDAGSLRIETRAAPRPLAIFLLADTRAQVGFLRAGSCRCYQRPFFRRMLSGAIFAAITADYRPP